MTLPPPTFRKSDGTILTIQQALNKRLIQPVHKSYETATTEQQQMVWIRGNMVNAMRLYEDGIINESAYWYVTNPGLVDQHIQFEY
jgi:hypothetical protein